MDDADIEKRRQMLREALHPRASHLALSSILDEIDSLEEFERFVDILREGDRGDLIEYYREALWIWKDPVLPQGFAEKFPLLSTRLNTRQKIRIFLRGAYFFHSSAEVMGEALEDVLQRHEVGGEKNVVVGFGEKYRHQAISQSPLRVTFYTQIPSASLRELVFPGCRTGLSTQTGYFFDWRTKEERLAAGERL